MATTLPTKLTHTIRDIAELPHPASGYQARGSVNCPCGHQTIHYAWEGRDGVTDLVTWVCLNDPDEGVVWHHVDRCPACRWRLSYQWLAQAFEHEQATTGHRFDGEDRVRTTTPVQVGLISLPAGSLGTVDRRLPSSPPVYLVAFDTRVYGRLVSLVIREDEIESL